MSEGWKPGIRTLDHDRTHPLHPESQRAIRKSRGEPTPQHDHLVPCPCCGCLVTADMLMDVRLLPAQVRRNLSWLDRDFACDGCRETAHRTNLLSHETMVRSHSGTPSEVRMAREYDELVARLFPDVYKLPNRE